MTNDTKGDAPPTLPSPLYLYWGQYSKEWIVGDSEDSHDPYAVECVPASELQALRTRLAEAERLLLVFDYHDCAVCEMNWPHHRHDCALAAFLATTPTPEASAGGAEG